MNDICMRPKDGDLYKRITIGQHDFELRYGYYTDADRAFGEPAVIFPELSERRLYDGDGNRIVTAVQDPCGSYKASDPKTKEKSCIGCIHYYPPGEDMGICRCRHNHRDRTK